MAWRADPMLMRRQPVVLPPCYLNCLMQLAQWQTRFETEEISDEMVGRFEYLLSNIEQCVKMMTNDLDNETCQLCLEHLSGELDNLYRKVMDIQGLLQEKRMNENHFYSRLKNYFE